MVPLPRLVFLTLLLAACTPTPPASKCNTDDDCVRGRVCDTAKGECVDAADAACALGTWGCGCLPGGACNTNLACVSDVCVESRDGGDTPGSSGPSSTGDPSSGSGPGASSSAAPPSSSAGGASSVPGDSSSAASACTSGSPTDPAHCGACGHDCGRGDCMGGVCQPFTWTDGAGNAPYAMVATADGTLFWAVSDPLGGTTGSIRKATMTRTPTVEVIAGNEPHAWALAVDDSHLFWTRYHVSDDRFVAVRRMARTGPATPEDVATGATARHARDVAVHGGVVYWVNSLANPNAYARADHGAGTVQTAYTGTSLGAVMVGGTLAYLVSNMAGIWTAPLGLQGSAPTSAYTYGGGSPGTLVQSAMDDTRLAWSTDFGLVVACTWPALSCNSSTVPVPGSTSHYAAGLVFSGPWLYYTAATGAASRSSFVYRVDAATLANPVKLADADEARGIAIHDGFVYWAEASRTTPRIRAMRLPP